MHRLIKRYAARTLLLAFLLGVVPSSYPNHALGMPAPAVVESGRTIGWETMPAILARIKAPRFPARDFRITDYDARPNADDNTEAIRKAIEACHTGGGGRVVVPPGVFQTGAIHLKSNVNLHLSAGATLKFIPDPAKYLPVVHTRFEGTECMRSEERRVGKECRSRWSPYN